VTVTVRAATRADEARVLDLVEELFDPPAVRPPDYTRERGAAGFRAALARPDADVLLAFDGERLVGLSSVYVDLVSIRFGPRCWLQDLVVAATARGAGVGRRLLDASAAWARDRGCTHLELTSAGVREDTHRFYMAAGMRQSSLAFSLRL